MIYNASRLPITAQPYVGLIQSGMVCTDVQPCAAPLTCPEEEENDDWQCSTWNNPKTLIETGTPYDDEADTNLACNAYRVHVDDGQYRAELCSINEYGGCYGSGTGYTGEAQHWMPCNGQWGDSYFN